MRQLRHEKYRKLIQPANICQLLHSSSDHYEVHTWNRRTGREVAQPVEVHSRRIHRHLHPQLLLLRSLHAVKRRFRAHFARIWFERFYGSDGKC